MADEFRDNQKVILRFIDGKMLKGYIRDLKIAEEYLYLEDESGHQLKVRLKELKAIFYVRKFEGERGHQEKKTFAHIRPEAKRVFVNFKDGETIMGVMEGEIPWRKGFFLESMKEKAFTIVPVDESSNNIRILVVTTAVQDVSLIGA
jgi:hypothetical protein